MKWSQIARCAPPTLPLDRRHEKVAALDGQMGDAHHGQGGIVLPARRDLNMLGRNSEWPSFPGLMPEDLADLFQRATLRTCQKNTIVVSEGDESDTVYFVLSGRLKVFLSDAQGKEVVINTLGAGEYFGEMSLEPGGRSASVMALEPSRMAAVRMADFRTFLLDHPEFLRSDRLAVRHARTQAGHLRLVRGGQAELGRQLADLRLRQSRPCDP